MRREAILWVGVLLALGLSAGAVLRVLLPPRPAGLARARVMIDAADRDADGRLSEAEYRAVSDPDLPFDLVDLDRDGLLDAREAVELLVAVDPLCLVRERYGDDEGAPPEARPVGSGSR